MQKDLVSFYDEDYYGGNGAEYWELVKAKKGDEKSEHYEKGENGNENLIPLCIQLGFKNEAEMRIRNIFSFDNDDITNISAILDDVGVCLGSHVSQFTFEVNEGEEEYSVAIAYLY